MVRTLLVGKVAFLVAIMVGNTLALAASTWDFATPCGNALTCTGPIWNQICYCETDWDDCDVWDETCGGPCSNKCYPFYTNENTTIERSDVGRCSGGGEGCLDDDDCQGAETCDDKESRLEISLVDADTGDLTIKVESTAASTDKINIMFYEVSSTEDTVTVNGTLTLDATNGVITLHANDGATLKTS